MKKLVLFATLLLISGSVAFAQTAEDYRVKAEQGDAKAQFNLAVCYGNGYGVTKNMEKAVYWFTKAAEQGQVDAQYNLGVCYTNGFGVEKNLYQSFKWFKKAAEQGYVNAQNQVARAYYFSYGTEKNYEEAFKWFKISALKGHKHSQAYTGICYYSGDGVQKDYTQALDWLNKAAKSDDGTVEYANAIAMFYIGNCYSFGNGVNENKGIAKYWYNQALKTGELSEVQKVIAQRNIEAITEDEVIPSSISGNIAFAQTNENWLQKLFPIYGVTLLETTIQDAGKMGYECKKQESGSIVCRYYINKDVYEYINIWDFDKDGILEFISCPNSTSGTVIPELWINNYGFNKSKSYEEWLAVFKNLGFTVTINKAPTTEIYRGRSTFKANVTAVSPDKIITFDLDFSMGNKNNEGYTQTSKNSLYGIMVRANKEAYAAYKKAGIVK